MKDEIEFLLTKKGYLPYEGNKLWKHITVEHVEPEIKPINNIKKDKVLNMINHLNDESAVYIYTCTSSKKVLYIGETNSIKKRFKKHYRKVYKDKHNKDFDFNDEFFQHYQGEITIYWLGMNGTSGERKQLESLLIYLLGPIYEEWKHKYSTKFLKDIT